MSNIEEDIKKVKELNNLLKFFKTHGWIPDMSRELNTNATIEAIEHLLSDYTRQKQINEEHQKTNGELREKVRKLEKENSTLKNFTSDLFNEDITETFMRKDKIKNKIEELKRQRRELGFKIYIKREDMIKDDKKIVCKIKVLEELLQESEDK